MDCLFCKITGGEIPSKFVYEDESVVAFRDINPQAPQHILIVPRKHIESINAFEDDDKDLAAHILVDVIPKLAKAFFNCLSSFFELVILMPSCAKRALSSFISEP